MGIVVSAITFFFVISAIVWSVFLNNSNTDLTLDLMPGIEVSGE